MRKYSAKLAAAGVLAFGLTIVGTPSYAGDNNLIHVKQESFGGGGNSMMIDQSLANDSLVVGPSEALLEAIRSNQLQTDPNASQLRGFPAGESNPAALQRGDENTATLTMTGDGGVLQLLQDNSPGQPAAAGTGGNTATITATGAGTLGAVIQLGNLNNAALNLNGDSATGLIEQTGGGLTAELTVQPGGSGQIIQNGTNSDAQLAVQSGSSATYTQNGNNLRSVGTAGATVFSTNPGTISITQTGFSGL